MIYLYGFVPADAPSPPRDLPGVGGGGVELLPFGRLSVAVSRVPSENFGEGALPERLRDLEWVAEQGASHERVVTWFVDRAEILPVRLLSLYTSEDSLEAEVRGGEGHILGELERLAGLREWDLKVTFDADELAARLGDVSEEIGALDDSIEKASPGRGYLLARKRKDESRVEVRTAARRLAAELLDEAEALAQESTVLPLVSDKASLPVVLNAALLVPRAREDELRSLLRERAEALEAYGLEVRFSGPWAPYRFVKDEGEDEDQGQDQDENENAAAEAEQAGEDEGANRGE